MKTSLDGYTPLPDQWVEKYGVIGAAVLGKILRYSMMGDHKCYASLTRIGEELGLATKTVYTWIQKGIEGGDLLVLSSPPGRPKEYQTSLSLSVETRIANRRSEPVQVETETSVNFTDPPRYNLPTPSVNFTDKETIQETKNKQESSPIPEPETPTPKNTNGNGNGKKGDLVDAILHFASPDTLDFRIKAAVQEHLKKTPTWDRKTNRDWLQWAVGQGEDFLPHLDSFMSWWKSSDWRGKMGQLPTLDNVRENWPQATSAVNQAQGFQKFIPGVTQL